MIKFTVWNEFIHEKKHKSGLTYKRNNGKIFYFQPGHETFPTYYNKEIQKVIINAVRWANPEYRAEKIEFPQIPFTNQF